MNFRLFALIMSTFLILAACGTGSDLKGADKTEKAAQNEKLVASDFPQLITKVQK